MEAAATLTNLLLNQQRPSMSTTAGSPRSCISAGSDPGSVHSFAHYAQSAARTAAGGTPGPSSSQQSVLGRATRSTATPPHSPAMSQASPALSHRTTRRSSVTQGSSLRPEGAGTPKMTPRVRADDTDAADMLLLMATSPSPARPTTTRDRDAADANAFRALRGGSSALKGRVLFPTYGGGEDGAGNSTPRMLSREMSGSFGSVSSTTTEPASPQMVLGSARRQSMPAHPPTKLSMVQGATYASGTGHLDVPMLPTITPPTPTDQEPSPEIIPSTFVSPQSSLDASSQSYPSRHNPPFPHTPNASFSLSDYMNVSPSPMTAIPEQHQHSRQLSSQTGRRLFQGHHGTNGASPISQSASPSLPAPPSPAR